MRQKKPKFILFCTIIFMLTMSLATAADDGKKVYDKKCASCHGKDGKGNAAMVKMLKVDLPSLDLVDNGTQDKIG